MPSLARQVLRLMLRALIYLSIRWSIKALPGNPFGFKNGAMSKKPKPINTTLPTAIICTSDDGGVGKTTLAGHLVTAHVLASAPLDLFQIDSKGKLAAKTGMDVTSLTISAPQRGEDVVPADVIAPWYRTTTSMNGTGRSTLLEVGGAMSSLFHAAITDLDLAEDIGLLNLNVVVFVVCKAGEDSTSQLLRELDRLEHNLPGARIVIVLNEVAGNPRVAADYFDDDLRKRFTAALRTYPSIRIPKLRPRSMAIYERMHALPAEIVSWHADSYREAIRKTALPRDQAKLFIKDLAEWSAIMQDEIARVLLIPERTP